MASGKMGKAAEPRSEYIYLGILKANGINYNVMKEKTKNEYLW